MLKFLLFDFGKHSLFYINFLPHMKSPRSHNSKEFLPHVIIRLYLPLVSCDLDPLGSVSELVPSFPPYVVSR